MAAPNAQVIESTRARLRAEMPVTRKWAYLDHAAVAPITAPCQAAMAAWVEQAATEGDTRWWDWAQQVAAAREAGARLIHADPAEITLVGSTTQGINLVAEGLDWRPGDNVVTLADEYPSNLYPWMHLADRGVETRRIPTQDGRVDYDQLAAGCDERTRVITVSWVGYSNGCRRDLGRLSQIAADCGALFFVDAIQALGAFPLNVQETPIDFLAADSHKWMLGPEGAGIAYIRRDRLPLLRATGVGAASVKQGSNYHVIALDLRDDAARYEGGAKNMAGLVGMGASLRLLESLGPGHLAACVLEITDYACERLDAAGFRVISPREEDQGSGIVSFELTRGDVMAARRHCLEQGVALACRSGRMRISPHAYNTREDVDRLMAALETLP
ncbi:MAG TPA: aminotransferase class V-fold PLP-dependent enzyme [Lacipirellulaceae bacterium]|nr:aminotransferase class V-fold PLP-dependent enzyme [Lacipirellulaceae bacterium]